MCLSLEQLPCRCQRQRLPVRRERRGAVRPDHLIVADLPDRRASRGGVVPEDVGSTDPVEIADRRGLPARSTLGVPSLGVVDVGPSQSPMELLRHTTSAVVAASATPGRQALLDSLPAALV